MLRLLGLLATASLAVGGFLTLDFTRLRNVADAAEAPPPTVQDYFAALPDRIATFTARPTMASLPSDLAGMLPKPPEGWTVRPPTAEDVAAFLPKGRDGDRDARNLIEAAASPKARNGAEVVVLTYENDDRKVMVSAVRYPDDIFTSPARARDRFALQTEAAKFRALDVLTVRGLDVTEDYLPEGMRGRLFMADVGGQIHLRILTPKRMKDAELVTFFQTLHVEAMNAAVVDRQDGLGKVPVIVLASALSDPDREVYQTGRTLREAEAAARARLLRDEAEAAIPATGTDVSAASGAAAECVEGAGGVKRCKVTD